MKQLINLRNVSIKNKLVLGQVSTSVIILVLCCIAFVMTDITAYKERKVDSSLAIAQVIGSNSVSAIQFLDTDAARYKLAELSVEPDVLNAVILDKKGNLFASYIKPGAKMWPFSLTETQNKKFEIANGYLFVYNNIIKDKEIIGVVCLQIDLSEMQKVINGKISIAGIVLLIGIIFTFLIALFVQQSVSAPLLQLVRVMQEVKETGNYKIRSAINGKDEINTLSVVFNDMLEQIQKREIRIHERSAELEIANKEMESFSYSVSHDLRAPIRAINGFANIMQDKYVNELDEEGKELLKIIINEAVRMGQLIDDLLAFSRLGNKPVQKVRIDMTTLAKEAVKEALKLVEQESKATINVKEMPYAMCDGVLIGQVFINLISNALKYSHTKPNPVIEIASYTEGNSVVYYVKDNGVGFDMKYYNKLFGVFQRLHSKEEFAGTGIGLAIVQRIVTRHGGKVWAEAKVDEGATFFFSIPK